MRSREEPPELPPVFEAFMKDIDRTLIRENLKLTHQERLLRLMQLQRFAHAPGRAPGPTRRCMIDFPKLLWVRSQFFAKRLVPCSGTSVMA
jgi:hypothetical protein